MAKIVRFLLILTTIFTLSFYLPSLYRRTVEKRPLKTMIYFSEVSRDFVIARETIDSATQEGSMLYSMAGTISFPKRNTCNSCLSTTGEN